MIINMINYTFIYLALKRNVQWEKLLETISAHKKYLIDLWSIFGPHLQSMV